MADRPVAAVAAHLFTSYRSSWRNSVFNSFLLPLFLLIGIGWSVGRHVDGPAKLGMPYLSFVGPGLLAAAVVQIAAAESAWAVFGGFEWSRVYHAMRLTPAGPGDIMAGHLAVIVARAVLGGAGFLVVLEAFGVGHTWGAVLVVLLSPLFALAVAPPVMAFSATIRSAGMFDVLFRLGIVPMSLFSGVYFPLRSLPAVLHAVALALPLSHAVSVVRAILSGHSQASATFGHLAVLVAWAAVGAVLARRAFTRRLAD
jgi:lipooligosaccharide transport system permease protein